MRDFNRINLEMNIGETPTLLEFDWTSLPPIVSRHNAFHECIKQGNSESGVAMTGAPDHAFND